MRQPNPAARTALLAVASLAALLWAPAPARATGPLPIVKATWADTNLPPGGTGLFEISVRNAGDAPLAPGTTIEERLPPGVSATKLRWNKLFGDQFGNFFEERVEPCTGDGAPGPGNPSGIAGATRITCRLDDLDAALGLGRAPGVGLASFTPAPSGYLTLPDIIRIEVAIAPEASGAAANTATVTDPIAPATERDGGQGQNEAQTLAVKATAGTYRLTPTTARGTGTLSVGATEVSGLSTELGAFHAGDAITGTGIPWAAGAGDLSAGSTSVTYANAFTFGEGRFAEGQTIAAPGIPPATTIVKVERSPNPPGVDGVFYTLTLSAPASASGSRGLLAYTTLAATAPGALTLSANAAAGGPAALSATETTAPIAFDAPATGPGGVQGALAALPGIGAGNVSVTGGPGEEEGSHPYTIAFGGALADTDLPQLEAALGDPPLSGGAADATDTDSLAFSSTPSGFGVVPGSFLSDVFDAAFPAGSPSRQAGEHPFEQRVSFDLNRHVGENVSGASPNALVRSVEVTLPRGMIGNPEALPKCAQADFAEDGAYKSATGCPADTQVGYLTVSLQGGPLLIARAPIYSLEPPHGTPVDLAFTVGGYVQGHIYATLDPAQGYAIKTLTPDIGALVAPLGTEVTVWGVPADPAHDFFRVYPEKQANEDVAGAPWGSAPIRPYLTTPMDCGADNGGARIRIESYSEPGLLTPATEYPEPLDVSGCEDPRFRFEPEISLEPTDRHAGAPTGLDVHLRVPQRSGEVKDPQALYAKNGEPQGIATPPIKKAIVSFPEGMTLNPSAAQGLGSCAADEIRLGTNEPVSCPDSSQYGTLTLHTPLLPVGEPMEGRIYIARQNENPFHNFLSIYLVIEQPERGLLVKIPGRVDLDPLSGQITTSFDDLPQFPLSEMQMSLKSGVRAGLVEPSTCGEKTITATFYSWQDPGTPVSGESSYEVTQNPDGSPCHRTLGERPFDPFLEAGTLNPLAGTFSPLEIRMTRTDEDQELSAARGTAPPGLSASLRGVGRCSDAQITAAADPARTGAEEQASPSCPASSLVGTLDAGAGTGQALTWVEGKVYLAGPYEGAPVSGVAIVPATAGPFDLGVIVTRAPAYVDPTTAQITLKTDPLPQIIKGVPVRVRDVRVHLDRPGFTLNPTSCEAMAIDATLLSSEGKQKSSSTRFQASECAALGFKPRLSFRLFGATDRGAHPKLRAKLTFPKRGSYANVARAQVTLPHSEFLDNAHIRTVCTRVQFAARSCPAGSIYGHAVARTPLFEEPLEGPVYLRSSSHKLPDLVAALRGPASFPVEVDLEGRIDSIHGGIRNSFELVPDAPVKSFTLTMKGGRKGLLQNSTDLCARVHRASARFAAHNGRAITLRPKLRGACPKRPSERRAPRSIP